MSILCNLKNISLNFGLKTIFKKAQLTINGGDRIGRLGLNGKGKSTLFKILNEEVVPDHTTPAFEFHKARGEDNQRISLFYVPQE
jgi:ATP-binding cassette subfamily F protein uup